MNRLLSLSWLAGSGWLSGSAALFLLCGTAPLNAQNPKPEGGLTKPEKKKTAKNDPGRFDADIAKLEQDARPLSADTVLFVGSSMVRLWKLDQAFPSVKTLNHGFGGANYADIAHYYPRVLLPYQPKRLVLYAGDNDLNQGAPPEVIAIRVEDLLTRIEKDLPGTKVWVLAIKPSPARIKLIEAQKYTNKLIEMVCGTHANVQFVDTFTPAFKAPNSPREELFADDKLHFSDAGYAPWNQILTPILTQNLPPNQAQPVADATVVPNQKPTPTATETLKKRLFPNLPARKRLLPWRNPG